MSIYKFVCDNSAHCRIFNIKWDMVTRLQKTKVDAKGGVTLPWHGDPCSVYFCCIWKKHDVNGYIRSMKIKYIPIAFFANK